MCYPNSISFQSAFCGTLFPLGFIPAMTEQLLFLSYNPLLAAYPLGFIPAMTEQLLFLSYNPLLAACTAKAEQSLWLWPDFQTQDCQGPQPLTFNPF